MLREGFYVNILSFTIQFEGLSPGPVKLWLEVAVDENAGKLKINEQI